MPSIARDLHQAARSLLRRPGFLVLAAVTLALGLGANTAIFSLLDAVLLRALPYSDPNRLVLLWGDTRADGNHRNQVSFTDVEDLRRQTKTLAEVAAYTDWKPILSGQGEAERIPAMLVSEAYFRVLRGSAVLGRTFVPEEHVDGKDGVVVLGHALWRQRFGADPKIVGRSIVLNGRPHTVVGVASPALASLPRNLIGEPAQLYRPVGEASDETQRDARHLRAIARLAPGATIAAAQAEVRGIGQRLEREHPNSNTGYGIGVVLFREDQIGGLRAPLLALWGAVGLVLLVACANVANLLLARLTARQGEITLRTALGASRGQLAAQFVAEGLILAGAGGLLGGLFATATLRALERLGADWIPSFARIEMSPRVFAVSAFLCLLTGVFFGLAPALRFTRPDLAGSLRSVGARGSAGRQSHRFRGFLVAAQVALSLIVLSGAALLIRSVLELRRVDPGFSPDGVLTANVWLPRAKYPEAKDWNAFYDRLLDRVAALPNVQAAGLTSVLPLSSGFDGRGVLVEGRSTRPEDEVSIDLYAATPGYLDALRIPLLRGRGLTAADRADAPFVALVNETMARKLWPGQDPLGKRFKMDTGAPSEKIPWRTVAGVVRDVRHYGLDRAAPMQMYFPLAQEPGSFMTLAVRTATPAGLDGLASALRREVRALDADQAVFDVATMPERIATSLGLRRFALAALAFFAAIALALALVGIYGVLSFVVVESRREIGVRLALGAGTGRVVGGVLGRGMAPAAAGLAAGLAASLAVGRLLGSLLWGVQPTDLATHAGTAAILAVAAALACLVPARRAARIDPMESLRVG